MIPKHWKLLLDGFGDQDSGDMIFIEDGEVIGTWSLEDDVFYTFTPNGEEEHLFFEPFLGTLCAKVVEWHQGRTLSAHATPGQDEPTDR